MRSYSSHGNNSFCRRACNRDSRLQGACTLQGTAAKLRANIMRDEFQSRNEIQYALQSAVLDCPEPAATSGMYPGSFHDIIG
jgi:hypothetical protein